QQIDQRLAALNKEIQQLTEKYGGKLIDEKLAGNELAASLSETDRKAVRAALLVLPDKRNAEQKKLLAEKMPKLDVTDAEFKTRFPEVADDIDKLNAAVKAELALKKTPTALRGLVDLGDKPPESFVLRRGDFNQRGKEVGPGVPAVLAAVDFKFEPQAG